MFVAMSDDVRLIFVKLADRSHNMLTLAHHPDEKKRRRIALETMTIYAPIADRLGIFEFKELLETECFRHLYPEEFAAIERQMQGLAEEQEIFTAQVNTQIRSMVPLTLPILGVSSRVKSPWSIYKKMQRKGYATVRDIYDIFAVRIITDSVSHCYEILGVVHSDWTPVPKRFKDYIALPKENGYQSIHTTIVGMFQRLRQQPTEIQIRTQEMHEHAEIGIAAHFEYSDTGRATVAQDIEWVRELKKIVSEAQDDGFYEHMQSNVFEDRIFVFTPKGDIKTLPAESTPIDFAYSIHSDIGDRIAFAKVNGKGTTLDTALKNGDTVEVITQSDRHPSASWLSFVKTSRARDVIKAYLAKEERGSLIDRGRLMTNAYLEKKFGITLDKDLTLFTDIDGHTLTLTEREDILVQIGNHSRKPTSLVRGIELLAKKLKEEAALTKASETIKKVLKRTSRSQPPPLHETRLLIADESGVPHTMAHCCNPVSGDRIIGYITRGDIRVHKVSCSSLRKANLARLLPCRWEGIDHAPLKIRGSVNLGPDPHGLKNFIECAYHLRVMIESLDQMRSGDASVKINFTLISNEDDFTAYERLIDRLKHNSKHFVEAELTEMR